MRALKRVVPFGFCASSGSRPPRTDFATRVHLAVFCCRYHSRSVKSLRHPFFVALLSLLLLFVQQGRLLHEHQHGLSQLDESSLSEPSGERQDKSSTHAQLCKLCLSFHALDALAVGSTPVLLAGSAAVHYEPVLPAGITTAAPAAYRSRAPPSFLA